VYECDGVTYVADVDLPDGADASTELESRIDADGWVFKLIDTGAEPEEEDGDSDDDGDDDDDGEDGTVLVGVDEPAA
jgi:hypothetical protein